MPAAARCGTFTDRPDSVLVALLATSPNCGDAWSQLHTRHHASVDAVARTILGNGPGSADVVTAVFEDLWRAPHRFDPARGTLLAYLRQMARSRSIDLVRAEDRRCRREVTHYRGSLHVVASVDTEGAALAALQVAWVHDALQRLPEAERRPIALAYIEGLPYTKVAIELGLPEGTVKGRIRRGLRRLRADTVAVTGDSSTFLAGADVSI